MLMYIALLASKKKMKGKPKTPDADAADSDFSTDGLGQPLQGRPLDDEMIVMEGSSNIPPSSAESAEAEGTDSSKTKRDDL